MQIGEHGTTGTDAYTKHGQPDTVTDALSHASSFTYDPDGNCTLVVDANSNQTSATYDGLGHKLTATDELPHTTTWTLDAWERATGVTTPAGTTTTAYDADSLVTSVTDDNSRPLVANRANGDTVTNTYGATGSCWPGVNRMFSPDSRQVDRNRGTLQVLSGLR